MPAAQSGSPMTYFVDGKQYIIVAVSGGNYSGDYIAFSLAFQQLDDRTQQRTGRLLRRPVRCVFNKAPFAGLNSPKLNLENT